MRNPLGTAFLLAMMFAAHPGQALAHKLNVVAHVEGTAIHGKASFRGGGPARGVQVTTTEPATGKTLGQTMTDDDGNFVIEARVRCDHQILVDTGDGHGAAWTIHAAELPATLPASESSAADGKPSSPPAKLALSPPLASAVAVQDGNRGELLAEIQALQRQVVALGTQVNDYENRLRLRDILGGIGYILGLAGIACYFLGRKRDVD